MAGNLEGRFQPANAYAAAKAGMDFPAPSAEPSLPVDRQPVRGDDVPERSPPAGITWHPHANLFPWIEGASFREFVEDVRVNGVLDPVVFYEGMVLDGRNRVLAATEAGVPFPRVDFEGDDPLAFVIARNLHRRHLTEGQRAMMASRLATAKRGRPSGNKSANVPVLPSQAMAAKAFDVSERSVRAARQVQEHGVPELVEAVDRGEVAVSAAAEVAALPRPAQRKAVAAGRVTEVAARERQKVDTHVAPASAATDLPSAFIALCDRIEDVDVRLMLEQAGMRRALVKQRAASLVLKINEILEMQV